MRSLTRCRQCTTKISVPSRAILLGIVLLVAAAAQLWGKDDETKKDMSNGDSKDMLEEREDSPRNGILRQRTVFARDSESVLDAFVPAISDAPDSVVEVWVGDERVALGTIVSEDGEVVAGKRFSTMTGNPQGKLLLAPVEPFKQRGQSGAWVSDFLPYTAQIADELCFVKSMHTDAVNHAPAISFLLSGSQLPGRPTLGAWMSYGLGCETDSLPSFVVMTSVTKDTTCGQIFYDFYWGSGFLPSKFQGVKFRGSGQPVLYLEDPAGVSRSVRRGILDEIAELNRVRLEDVGDPEISTRISQYEMAFRMQSSVPDLTDLSDETQETLDMYGPGVTESGTFAHNCLMARRLIERGVRYVQCMHAGWDQHNSLTTELYSQCRDTDQPSAALVLDLKRRGLLEDTLVVWGGEFGRTPFLQGDLNNRVRWGRDHHPYAFTVWMAGGGVQPGMSFGASDEFGLNAVENRVHVHDLQATWMHLLGIDHERLTFKFQGRNFRLTDVHGHVVRDILA